MFHLEIEIISGLDNEKQQLERLIVLGNSSTLDTEARIRKCSARRIRAIPSLTKIFVPIRTVAKD
jgi:hypothetical protein